MLFLFIVCLCVYVLASGLLLLAGAFVFCFSNYWLSELHSWPALFVFFVSLSSFFGLLPAACFTSSDLSFASSSLFFWPLLAIDAMTCNSHISNSQCIRHEEIGIAHKGPTATGSPKMCHFQTVAIMSILLVIIVVIDATTPGLGTATAATTKERRRPQQQQQQQQQQLYSDSAA